MIDRLISQVAERAGLRIDQARELTGRLLTMAEAGLGPHRMAEIVDAVPGARAVMGSVDQGRYSLSETGILGAAATGRFGGTAGVAWVAEQLNLPVATVEQVGHLIVSFFGDQAGSDAEHDLADGLFPPSIEEDDEADRDD